MLQPNPVEEMVVELGLDVLDFALNSQKMTAMTMSDMEIDENVLEVSKDSCNVRIKLTANSWEQIAECNANHALTNHPDAIADSETTRAEPTTVKTACEWLEIDEEEGLASMDIFTVINRCLKDLRKIEMWTYCEDDDPTDGSIRVCQAPRTLSSPWQVQEAMSKCQSCNCSLNGQRLLLRTPNPSE